jgi:hypothetical protein
MGWASGSSLMNEIIEAFKPLSIRVEHATQVEFWKKVIAAFEEMDCDTLDECMEGKTVPTSYKKAYWFSNPWSHGYAVGCGDEPAPEGNPWNGVDEDKAEKYADGLAEGRREC